MNSGHIAQLTQASVSYHKSQGKRRSGKGDGGNSGSDNMIQDNEKLLQNKLDRAKKDLKFWKSMNDKIGQPKPDHPDLKLFFSCEIMNYCDSKELGKCVFYNCHTRPSKLEWKEHHEKCHPKDNILYVCRVAMSAKESKMKKPALWRAVFPIW